MNKLHIVADVISKHWNKNILESKYDFWVGIVMQVNRTKGVYIEFKIH